MSERDPGRLADEMEREGDVLEERSQRLDEEVERVRQDWEHKRGDPNVPGAPPRGPDEAGEADAGPAPEAEFPVKESSREDE
jgi:hypothetical protein